jgi:methionyl-tRNA synthetase
MTTPFYITTPIYYVNDVPHLGHAYTTIVADALARFHRMRGDATRFLTGTDEHGQKVEEAATKRGLTPRQLVDQVAPRFAETWRTLGITNDHFIRTTDEHHQKVVAALWKRIRANNPGDLYLHTYQGWYCVACEQFYKESDLLKVGDTFMCSIHTTRPVEWIDKERSWFFKLERYAQPLLDHIEAHPDFIRPEAYRNEIVSFLKGGLKDLSVSRTSFSWGIPVPEDDPDGAKHVIYVWMDALTNYLSDLCDNSGQIQGPLVDQLWPHAVHLIGKDILRFHSVYWPAFLLSAGLPLPKGIVAHGWWNVRGMKISKSVPATRVDPVRVAQELGVRSFDLGNDALRYYLLREVPLGSDGDFTLESLFGRFNAELANDLGNLVNRSLTLLARQNPDALLARDASLATSGPRAELETVASEAIAAATTAFEAMQPSRALEAIWKLVREGNRYVDATQPWTLAKDVARLRELQHVLHGLASVIGVIGGLITPVLPTAGATLREWVGIDSAQRGKWPGLADLQRDIVAAGITRDGKPLFPRFDDATQKEIIERLLPDAPTTSTSTLSATATPPKSESQSQSPSPSKPTSTSEPLAAVTIDEFKKMDLRVGKILSAVPVPKAKKLLHLQIDLGEAKPRSIVSGIAEAYEPGALVGKQVIVVANLPPVTLRGVLSEGMILAAGDGSGLGVSAIDRDVPPGTRVS